MTSVGFEVDVAEPSSLVAVTRTRSRKPASACRATYVLSAAFVMRVQLDASGAPRPSQRNHRYANVIGVVPDHDPRDARCTAPTRGVPVMLGSPVAVGATCTAADDAPAPSVERAVASAAPARIRVEATVRLSPCRLLLMSHSSVLGFLSDHEVLPHPQRGKPLQGRHCKVLTRSLRNASTLVFEESLLLAAAAHAATIRAVTAHEIDTDLASGYEALATGQWELARESFEAAVEIADVPEALDGLGRALWWLRDERGAIVHRERAYAGFRRDGDLRRASRIALWLSREYAVAFGREAVADGWLARAERLLRDVAPGAEQGWLSLTRSERVGEPTEAVALATEALDLATRVGDGDLELRALAQLGYAEVSAGNVEAGLRRLDEAMAAVTSGEPDSLETFADVCCTLMLASDLAGETDRPAQWARVLEEFVRAYDHVTLLSFCRTCCADVFAANGRVDAAENELLLAIRELTEAGQRSRCASPAARLAEIRVLQGRFDEAEALLDEYGDDAQTVAAAAALRLARGENAAAAALLERRIADLGQTNLLAAPLLGQLVEARLGEGRLDDARKSSEALSRLAGGAGRERAAAGARLAESRVAAATGDPAAADLLREAASAFAALGLGLDAARARLELARTVASTDSELAVDAARRARRELEALGATREADAAAALMRSLGAKPRSGPRELGRLSKRETEVLRLLGEGLSTRDLAARLYISPKTAEHHVSRIYAKLGFKTRGQAAAYAVTNLGRE